MEELESRYLEVMVHPEQLAAARALKPIYERQGFGRSILLFDQVDRQQLGAFGEVHTPSIADLFVAIMKQSVIRSGCMNTQSSAVPESFDRQEVTPAVMSATRPLYWSVRRELWEFRSIYIAPLVAAGVILFGFLISSFAGIWEKALSLDPSQPKVAEPYNFAALLIMASTFLVSLFYCLEALHAERRDRSILFWKSLPVSDLTDRAFEGDHSAGDSTAAHLSPSLLLPNGSCC